VGFLDTIGGVFKSVVTSDPFKQAGASVLAGLAARGARKLTTGASGDPRTAGGRARVAAIGGDTQGPDGGHMESRH